MKFGLMFTFQLPPGCGIPWNTPYQDMLDCLPRAEELGYESMFMATHHAKTDGLCPGPLIACAGAAAVTKTMRIGTAVLLVPMYAPLKLAEDIAVLDNLSQGRFVFGVAPGYVAEEFAAHGIPREQRVGRFEESLDLMITAWTEDEFEFDGKYFQVPRTVMTPKPMHKPYPPIWYGVSATKSLERAAKRRAVQIMSPRHGVQELKAHYAPYEAKAAELNWTIPERPIIRQVFVAPTQQQAEAIAAPAVNHLYRELYGKASAAGDRVLRADDGSVITDHDQVDFETFKDRYIIGDPEFAIQSIKRYESAINPSEMVCWMHMPGITGRDAMDSVTLFAREVMPHFQ
ncbi:MAG: alkanesulfonate monooxygenase SsuD [Gammaproteobacteria bacterium]|jgi:alkanesulfonate monooxygenase SsuD/methylene tetrahydromethanopterin reductase-like flavin-dependent oxidoreductase (luciferase family)